ncbi:MAG TPA: hypothetical protein VN700_14070 [Vicinamibacterales bacterium]|nr:hypothetical protein [Vicinamibacterales bacterium]
MNDLGEYCRRIEDHLTKANAGHLVRIVGPGFDLVRQWADAGVPLSVVYRGIDLKVERHRDGAARRPLRIEFCAGDVQSIFDHWKRAVGVGVFEPATDGTSDGDQPADADSAGASEPGTKRRSLSRHLDRAIDRLSRAAVRVDMPDGLRAECTRVLDALATLRETSAGRRGSARDDAAGALSALDAELDAAARAFTPAAWMFEIRDQAAADLAPFRARLPADAWARSIDVTVGRLIRDRFSLPVLEL